MIDQQMPGQKSGGGAASVTIWKGGAQMLPMIYCSIVVQRNSGFNIYNMFLVLKTVSAPE